MKIYKEKLHNGSLLLSAFLGNDLIKRQYMGFSLKASLRLFRSYYNENLRLMKGGNKEK